MNISSQALNGMRETWAFLTKYGEVQPLRLLFDQSMHHLSPSFPVATGSMINVTCTPKTILGVCTD